MIDATHSQQWSKTLVATQQAFARELEAEDCEATNGGEWVGPLLVEAADGRQVEAALAITIPDEFPFSAPTVKEFGGVAPITWHHNRDGTLCLWGRVGVADRPWETVGELFSRIRSWFSNAAAEFPNDPPDLDLERYFARTDELVLYRDIDSLIGKPVRARAARSVLTIMGAGTLKAGRGGRRSSRWGWAGDLGDLDVPVHDWDTVAHQLGDGAKGVERRLRRRNYEFLLLKYRRTGDSESHDGVLALFSRLGEGGFGLEAGEAASDSPEARGLRAGHPQDVAAVSDKQVAIVGVGAVGSFLADQLSRAGVGLLHLVDPERLRPGNCIRHLAGPSHAGKHKTEAVTDVLLKTQVSGRQTISRSEKRIVAATAVDLLLDYHLVIDATGDDPTTGLLVELAEHMERPLLSAALLRMGTIARIDRYPTSDGDVRPPPITPARDKMILREGGCGDPVAIASVAAVMAAASQAFVMAIDSLTDRHELPTHGDRCYRHSSRGPDILISRGRDLLRRNRSLRISHACLKAATEVAESSLPRETGGILLGYWTSRYVHVAAVLEVPDLNAGATSYTMREIRAQEVLEAALADAPAASPIGYVGDWHSHPGQLPPSRTDHRTLFKDRPALSPTARDAGPRTHCRAGLEPSCFSCRSTEYQDRPNSRVPLNHRGPVGCSVMWAGLR